MIFETNKVKYTGGSFVFNGKISAQAHKVLNKDILKEIWHGYTFRTSEIEISESNEFEFIIGNPSRVLLCENAYAINVDANGIYIVAENEKSLIHGFMTLVDRIRMTDDEQLEIKCFELKESPLVKTRMIHYCVAPETELWELERFIRLCGAMKYSHIILEFWGMIKFDCMKELAWDFALSKDEIRPLIKMANDLGMEVVPMLNHWGHASASREVHGKHVVLDKNPALQSYFSDDGWCWNLKNNKVISLLEKMRSELIEICGEGEYFHIGCDEARGFDFSKENMDFICTYLNSLNESIKNRGRKTIVWGDMFVSKRKEFEGANKYIANSKDLSAEEYMLGKLDKSIIIADWQYWVKESPVKTSLIFKNYGFDVYVCPWDRGFKETDACVDTAANYVDGIIHTTWNTLCSGNPSGMIFVVRTAADCCGAKDNDIHWHTAVASILRKVYFVNGEFEKAGWSGKSWEKN